MTFSRLAKYLERLEKTASRNEITEILARLFKEAGLQEIDKITYLLLGRIAPSYTGLEFNLAEKMMVRAVALAYGVKPEDVVRRYKEAGDIGDVAATLSASSKSQAPKTKPTVQDVYKRLHEIALESGEGSQERKLAGIAKLLQNLDSLSARYVVRVPVGKLRLGFSDKTMLDALSVMEVGDKSARKKIEASYNVTADIGKIAQRVKSNGVTKLGKANAVPGVPIRASLSDRLPSAEKIIEKVGPKVAVEPKLDGFRAMVHILKGGEVFIFSRNQENVTNMFPDIVKAVKKLKVKDAIFDSEAIGYNPDTHKFAPFQETVQRKRKYGISKMAKQVPLKAFVFDALYLNGKTLLNEPFYKRRQALGRVLEGGGDTITLIEQEVVDTPEELRKLFQKYFAEGAEGVMAKKLGAPYQAGGRGFHWVKFKKLTESGSDKGLFDTIDCVLMGAFKGRGKRAQFGVGGFLLGVPGKDGKFYTISNLGTGLTDEQFRDMYKRVKGLTVKTKPKEYVVDKVIEPDIWVRPELVLEVLADEITLSPRHTAGRASSRNRGNRGYSLRFPRLIRIRTDKNPAQATKVSELKKLFLMQKK